jgi:REP element-mobilizing transposase RayT
MTNHVHLIFRSAGEQKPESLIGDFKRFTSKAIVKAIMEDPGESRKEFLLDQFLKAGKKSSNVEINFSSTTLCNRAAAGGK